MRNALSQTVAETFCQVMESQTFMSPERVEPEALPLGEQSFLCATLSFSGAARGRVCIVAPADFATAIAANFLGMDVEDLFVQENSEDALKEVLNITSGNLLTTLYGAQAPFDLSVPDSHPLPPQSVSELAFASDSLCFDVEDHPVIVRVTLGTAVPTKGAPC